MFVAAMVVASCAGGPAGSVEGGDVDGVVRVTSDADIDAAVQSAWSRRVGGTTASELVVELDPGTYHRSLQLSDLASKGLVTVTIRGKGGAAVFDGGQISVDGARVTLENIVVTGWSREAPALQLRVRDGLLLDHVAVVDNRRGPDARRAGALVRLVAGYRTGPKDVTVRDSWFVGNGDVPGDVAMIAAEGVAPDRIGKLRIERSVLAADGYARLLAPGLCDAVEVVDSVAVTGGAIGYAMNGKTSWSFTGSTLAGSALVVTNPKLDASTFPTPSVDGVVSPPRAADRAALGDAPIRAATPDLAAVRLAVGG